MYSKIIENLTKKALNLSRPKKISVAIFLDMIICTFATWIALSIDMNKEVYINYQFAIPAFVSIILVIPVFLTLGVYNVILRYINGDTFQILTKAIIFYTIILSLINVIFNIPSISKSYGFVQPMIFFLLVAASRLIVKIMLSQHISTKSFQSQKKDVIIYGCGDSGRQLAANLIHSKEYKFLFFVDDNKSFWGGTIDGYSVKSPLSINNISSSGNSKEIWLAMTNLSATNRSHLINKLRSLRIHVRTLPSFSDLTNNRVFLSDVRELNINELVGRNPVKPSHNLLKKCISKHIILVTGAGGSIGSEICRQILINKPSCILLAENSEVALYNINNELNSFIKEKPKNGLNKIILVPLLVNVQDENDLNKIFETWKPDIVYHAAAYKHVPIVEHNVVAGIKNNVMGTLRCANIAMKHKVKHFVLVSTDKAVRPTNIMGASKRLAEMILQLLSNDNNNDCTLFCIVRFGNVLGSSGSVVPLFRKQIDNGGPVTLTDENVTRYFMTIKEAAQLVIQAGAMSKGGEVFVLDMGQPIRISDLALNMIETAGLQVKNEKTPWGDIEIKITGLRPGEKLYEELLIGNNPCPTKHSRILQANETFIIKEDFDILIKKLKIYLDSNNVAEIHKLLKDHISGYLPSENVDWISKSKKNNNISIHSV